MTLTVATWNVNGIRAREAQVRAWIERDQPDVVCLQEIKAAPAQVPAALFEMLGYWNYWHGERAYSGVSLHVRRESFPERPVFEHPDFDYENRVVTARLPGVTVASIYVPNGGKDFPAKMRFLEAVERFVRERAGSGSLVMAGDVNIARTDQDVHPKERKATAIGQLPEERALLERILAGGLVDVARSLEPDERGALHLVGAVAQPPPAQHRLAHRLHPRERRTRQARDRLPRAGRLRDERPRARRRDVRRRGVGPCAAFAARSARSRAAPGPRASRADPVRALRPD